MLKVIGNPLKSCLDLDFANGIDPRFNNQNRILSINSNQAVKIFWMDCLAGSEALRDAN